MVIGSHLPEDKYIRLPTPFYSAGPHFGGCPPVQVIMGAVVVVPDANGL